MIHFGLFFWRVYGISIYSFFNLYNFSYFNMFIEKTALFPLNYLSSFVKNEFTVYLWIYICLNFLHVPLIYLSVFFFFFANITPSYVGFPGSGVGTNNNSVIMNQPAMQEMQGWPLLSTGWEDPLEKEIATHSSILSWETICAEQTDGLQSVRSQESDMS